MHPMQELAARRWWKRPSGIAVAVIVGGCAWEWARLLTGRKAVVLRESPYVTLPDPA